ncbi:undecaprenyldiphospho-muramoylpentapeptide beta-N-acetylglucosaminyltransferase [Carboxylicivirga sediminis]|uniref:UDP-N-acetylglucosamine--N-acetylmuramyl-(pentapeptide) pyrophosphoryl-undecaprenol N-acetylglucosamine transferase n=1 Tax=Carboxylicivirga sediminis TaxID=2006564 RepID=A0A941IYM7_9BACT|nr:undecaprenyldiphospho-muramoylpentapeptide beta-N-acetylglucosaminyltransferase [Carboxylicivirga sediminis]MBR8538051.1 undecaprenyldiphospho-muramoylpentapeptide beta-N-acetylglucosaminyltransferase [Carboxylicivirga sediminis]
MSAIKVIISGGGTGGHIFPAISIANAVKKIEPEAEILFVGALGKMEMEKVPAAGYKIVGLPVAGFHRKLTLRNLAFPFKLMSSMLKARKVIRQFKPDAAVGVGGYASGPVLRVASQSGVPSLLQEQNSFPGVTNRILAKKAERICVAYEGMERFFAKEKILLTGNPVRNDLLNDIDKHSAVEFWGLDKNKKTILIIGGSLGARSINNGIIETIVKLPADIQVIWQTGKLYYQEMKEQLPVELTSRVILTDFISRMDMAFAAADLVVSRAGASSISELAILGKPTVFVPSPNVSEDHQTKNAMALVDKDAAVLVRDAQVNCLIDEAAKLLTDVQKLEMLAANIRKFAKPDAARDIAQEVLKLAQNK